MAPSEAAHETVIELPLPSVVHDVVVSALGDGYVSASEPEALTWLATIS